jgi:replicative DNA helicase
MKRNEVLVSLEDVGATDVKGFLDKVSADLSSLQPDIYSNDDDLKPFKNGLQKRKKIKFTPTGIDFLDFYIDGFIDGCMYSYMGSTGSTKTTCSVQLAVSYAKKLLDAWRTKRSNAKIGKVFYITAEDGAEAIQLRMLSNAAQVDRGKLDGTSMTPLTTPVTLSANDRKLAGEDGVVFGEDERVEMAMKRLNANIRIIDLKDEAIVPKRMYPVDYIQQQIQSIMDSDKGRSNCSLIIIDHCEVLISRLVAKSKKETRYEIADQLPQVIRDKLATHFKCPVWCVHQLSGVANEKNASAEISHTDAKGSKSWGTYFDVCFSVGKVTRKERTCLLHNTKNRYKELGPRTQLYLHGSVGTLSKMKVIDDSEESLFGKQIRSGKKRDVYDGPKARFQPKEKFQVLDN